MATALAEAFVRIRATGETFKADTEKLVGGIDTKASGDKLGKGLGKNAASGFGSSFKTVLGGLGIGVGIAGAFKAFTSTIAAGRESNKVGALTAQVIKTTGGAAGVTAKQVGSLATAISNKTGVDDEAIQSGANLLLTFTGIRNEVGKGNDIFNQANKTVTDMSVALGQDTKNSAIQLGKALNDPVKGVTALSKVGVSFTQQQKDQIKTLVKSGDTVGAQKVILGELSKEFGGAAAASTTNSQKFGVAMGNLQESIGQKLIPVIDGFANILLTKVGPALGTVGGFFQRNSDVLVPLVAVVGAAVLVFKAVTFATEVWATVQKILNRELTLNPIGLVVVAIAALVFGLILAYRKSETFRNIVNGAFHAIQAVVGSVVGFIKAHWLLLFAILTGPVGLAVKWIHDHWDGIITFFKGAPGKIKTAFSKVGDGILSPFKTAFNAIADAWNGSVGKLSFHIPDWVPKIGGKGFSMPKIPHFAMGVDDFAGGLAVINERGPETVWLPAGANVTPHGKTPDMGGRQTTQVIQLQVDGRTLAEVIVGPMGQLLSNRPLP
jgi:acid phosphatase family membrane protein YuiD